MAAKLNVQARKYSCRRELHLSAIEDDRVEEAEREEQLLELLGLLALVEERIGEGLVAELQVLAQALWRLVGHFHAILQHRHWERFGRERRQPQAVVRMRLHKQNHNELSLLLRCGRDLFEFCVVADLRERGQPAGEQVAVLQQHPAARLARLLDVLGCDFALALTQRH